MSTQPGPTTVTTTGKPPRRRLRIPMSLRLFVAIFGVLGVWSIWFGVAACRQYTALRYLRDRGVRVIKEERASVPAWLRERLGSDPFDDVVMVLRNPWVPCHLTDADMPLFRRFPRLQRVELRGSSITDAGLRQLRGLRQLSDVDVRQTGVTESGMAELKADLPGLEIYGTPLETRVR